MTISRKGFLGSTTAFLAGGCVTYGRGENGYSVAILGDTHFDTEPADVYHSNYKNTWKAEWLWKVQRREFARNGEMWRKRCRDLLASSAAVAAETPDMMFVLQVGDIIQGDCDNYAVHQKMLNDCIRMLRAPYPSGLPFMTVVGNHDFRGIGGEKAYYEFAEPFMSRELGKPVKYPVFSQVLNGDLWVFCNFESRDLQAIVDEIEATPNVRHTFLVTHGSFTPGDGTRNWTWRLGGSPSCAGSRRKLYEVLSRRHAVVLSGHSHRVEWWRLENEFGSYSEFTANSVWCRPELATAVAVSATPADFGHLAAKVMKDDPKRLDRFRSDIAPFKKDLKEYHNSPGAGHFRLCVSDARVSMDFFPGAARVPAKTFVLK